MYKFVCMLFMWKHIHTCICIIIHLNINTINALLSSSSSLYKLEENVRALFNERYIFTDDFALTKTILIKV